MNITSMEKFTNEELLALDKKVQETWEKHIISDKTKLSMEDKVAFENANYLLPAVKLELTMRRFRGEM